MFQFYADLFQKWKLKDCDKIARAFVDAEIELEVLKQCTFDELAPVLSALPLGEKLKFKKSFEAWMKSVVILEISNELMPEPNEPCPEAENVSCNALIPDLPISYSSEDSIQDIDSDLSSTSFKEGSLKTPKKQSGSSPTKRSGETFICESPCKSPRNSPFESENVILEETPTAKSLDVPTSTSSNSTDAKSKDPEEVCSKETLRKLLDKCDLGKFVLLSYESTKQLETSHRSDVAKVVLYNEMGPDFSKPVHNSRHRKLAEYIVELFPSETLSEWFTPAKKIGLKQYKAARGRLPTLYHNTRRNLLKSGVVWKLRDNLKDTASNAVNAESNSDPDTQSKQKWLKRSVKPLSTVNTFWEQTRELRMVELTSIGDKNVISNYFELYKVLKLDAGLDLLIRDFDALHPDFRDTFVIEWQNLVTSVKNYIDDNLCKKVELAALEIDLEVEEDDYRTINTARAIGNLVNIRRRIKAAKEAWKPSPKELADGMFYVVPASLGLKKGVAARTELYNTHGLPLTPYAVAVTSDDKNLSFYVCINGYTYQVEDAITALSHCFKIFQLFKTNYPHESKISWYFLQKVVCKFHTPLDEDFKVIGIWASRLGFNSTEPSS